MKNFNRKIHLDDKFMKTIDCLLWVEFIYLSPKSQYLRMRLFEDEVFKNIIKLKLVH